MLKQF